VLREVATAAPRRRKLEIGAVTAVKRAPIHERSELKVAARVHENTGAHNAPPIAAGWITTPREISKAAGRGVHQPLEVDFEVIAILSIAPEHPPFESTPSASRTSQG